VQITVPAPALASRTGKPSSWVSAEAGMRGQSGRPRSPSAASPVSVDEACAVALDMGVQEYRFVGRYLERCPQVPLSVQQVKSLDS
jgi:hypothetical protein